MLFAKHCHVGNTEYTNLAFRLELLIFVLYLPAAFVGMEGGFALKVKMGEWNPLSPLFNFLQK